mmetsp:Transcript_18953/g.57251  ORF Transcript_18953/g.57251 Transcript_18953/m.57251 type:complete len:290 (+) Transcript_18953:839-1708(+)
MGAACCQSMPTAIPGSGGLGGGSHAVECFLAWGRHAPVLEHGVVHLEGGGIGTCPGVRQVCSAASGVARGLSGVTGCLCPGTRCCNAGHGGELLQLLCCGLQRGAVCAQGGAQCKVSRDGIRVRVPRACKVCVLGGAHRNIGPHSKRVVPGPPGGYPGWPRPRASVRPRRCTGEAARGHERPGAPVQRPAQAADSAATLQWVCAVCRPSRGRGRGRAPRSSHRLRHEPRRHSRGGPQAAGNFLRRTTTQGCNPSLLPRPLPTRQQTTLIPPRLIQRWRYTWQYARQCQR